jgi:hypothetical protein
MEFDLDYLKTRLDYDIDNKTGCWNITSHRVHKSTGYTDIDIKGKRYRVHRAVYISINGEIPEGKIIRHKCHNKRCMNPNHLLIGTKKDNTQDMLRAKRESRWANGGRHEEKDRDKKQKLTNEQIKEIKTSDLSSYKLAEIYPVSAVQIRRIKSGSRCKVI